VFFEHQYLFDYYFKFILFSAFPLNVKACLCEVTCDRAVLWIAFGHHYENRGKLDHATNQFRRSLSYLVDDDQRLELLQAFYQFNCKSNPELTLQDFSTQFAPHDRELLLSQVVEVIGVVSVEDKIRNQLQEAEVKGSVVTLNESSSLENENMSNNTISNENAMINNETIISNKRKLPSPDDKNKDIQTQNPIDTSIHPDSSLLSINQNIKQEEKEGKETTQEIQMNLDIKLEVEEEEEEEYIVKDEEDDEEEEVEEEPAEEENEMAKLLFPPTQDSFLSTQGNVIEIDNSYELKYPISKFAKTSIIAMHMLQLLKEKTFEIKNDKRHGGNDQIKQENNNSTAIKKELKELLEIQRTCLAEAEVESFLPKQLRKKRTLSRNAAVVRAVLSQTEHSSIFSLPPEPEQQPSQQQQSYQEYQQQPGYSSYPNQVTSQGRQQFQQQQSSTYSYGGGGGAGGGTSQQQANGHRGGGGYCNYNSEPGANNNNNTRGYSATTGVSTSNFYNQNQNYGYNTSNEGAQQPQPTGIGSDGGNSNFQEQTPQQAPTSSNKVRDLLSVLNKAKKARNS